MKKVTAFIGSARNKHTYETTEKFLKKMQFFGNVEDKIVALSNYNLGICKGCKLCLQIQSKYPCVFCRIPLK